MSINTISHLLNRATILSPNKIALIDGYKRYTYLELKDEVDRVAEYLDTLSLPKGSRVGIYSNKSSSQVVAILAILSTNYMLVPITRLLKPHQVKHIIDDCNIRCMITDNSKISLLKNINFEGKIISYDNHIDSNVSFSEIFKFYTGDIKSTLYGHSSAVITYSFGSQGDPKGVVIDHRALIDGARVVSNYLDIQENDIISGVLSFNLDYGLNQIFSSLYMGATLIIHRFLLPSDFFTHLINDKITILPLMPIHITETFSEDPHKIPSPEHFKNLKTITSSGGNITPIMLENIEKHFKYSKFYAMHGLTEAFRSTYLEPSQLKIRPTSIGKAIPDVELYIIDADGNQCKSGEIGELIHRGACIYKGYWNDREETTKRFKSIKILDKVIEPEGELTDEIVIASGDFVYADEEGYIHFISRADDMIKTRGYRVNPYEIEKVIDTHIINITSRVIFSIPNDDIEEEIILVYSAENRLSKNEIILELKRHLPHYMIPEQIEYREIMPLKSLHEREPDRDIVKNEFLESRRES